MHRLRRTVPSLGALVSFEAAARLLSFTAAADELGVTQAAVSRRIKELELDLGCQLFIRANRSVRLSAAGQILSDAVDTSFNGINDAISEIRSINDGHMVTIGVSLAFAHFRLLPSLSAFHNQHPDINVRVITQDNWLGTPHQDFDLILRYGRGEHAGRTIIAAVPDEVFPVCSPAFAQALGSSDPALFRLDDLARLPLIEGEEPGVSWLSWKQWFHQLGQRHVPVKPRLQFSNYSDAVYAAMNGDGIALGWRSLVHRALDDGRLVALGEASIQPDGQHQLIIKNEKLGVEPFSIFAAWLDEAMAMPT